MRWDATLDDGKGELPFGRPIRWLVFLYGGRVVPFTIIARRRRAGRPACRTSASGAVTYGHRFLTTSGRAGRAVKVKDFDDYRKRLAENFVVLERSERHEPHRPRARRRGAPSRRPRRHARWSGRRCSTKCRTWSSTRSCVSGTFADEFLTLPEEVLTTTMIHHQHFFPVLSDDGQADAGVPGRAQHASPSSRR